MLDVFKSDVHLQLDSTFRYTFSIALNFFYIFQAVFDDLSSDFEGFPTIKSYFDDFPDFGSWFNHTWEPVGVLDEFPDNYKNHTTNVRIL